MTDTVSPRRMRASDFHPHILEIFDGYVHGKLTKREFIRQAGRYAAAGVTGAMILSQLSPDYALAQQVAPDDPAIRTERVEYKSPEGHGTVKGLMAWPPMPGASCLPCWWCTKIAGSTPISRMSCGGWPRRAISRSVLTA